MTTIRSGFVALGLVVLLALFTPPLHAEDARSSTAIAMAANADGTCQIPSPKITLCQNVSPGLYRIEFARFAFSKTPLLVVMPLGASQTVMGISQGACPPNNCTAPKSGWFAQYNFSGGANAVHNFIAATGY
jgi:hypothetical protein